MINYYEVLEVSEKASDEIIEKVYKVLAKKYHPDLQKDENKKKAEEKMKLINEAYEILSDKTKREEYDKKLEQEKERDNIKKQENKNNYYSSEEQKYGQGQTRNNNYSEKNHSQERTTNNYYEEQNYNQEQQNINNNYYSRNYDEEEIRRQQAYREKLEREARKRYVEAYNAYLRRLGYRVKNRWTWERVKSLLITIVVLILMAAILWIIPPSREYMINLYEENFVIKIVVDIIVNLIKSIISIFKK